MDKPPARIKSMQVCDRIAADGKAASFSFQIAGSGDAAFVCSVRCIEQIILKLQRLLDSLREKALTAAMSTETADPTIGFQVKRPFGKSHISVAATRKSGLTTTILVPIAHIDGLLSQIQQARPEPARNQQVH